MSFGYIALCLGLSFLGAAFATTCSIPPEQLHQQRLDAFVQMQISPGFTCGQFQDWLNNSVKEGGVFMLPFIGEYRGQDSIFEYYQLTLQPGDGCSNFFGTQFLKLDNTPLPESIVQIDTNVYEGYHITDGFFNPDPQTGQFTVITKGHLTYGKIEFVECSDVIDHWLTGVENNEITEVSVANSAVSTPVEACGLMSFAQSVYAQRFGFYPSNITGFDLLSPTGFPDCIAYWTGIQARGDVCGTPLTTHTIDCINLHMTTFLTEGSRPIHAMHWANESLHTKCVDFCNPVLATCHPDAASIPRNEINFDSGIIEYFCECPVGWQGDGVTDCQPVSCTQDWQCDPFQFTFCDTSEGVCKPKDTFEWDRVAGEAFCPDDSDVFYNNGVPECTLNWRCNEQWQCRNQDYSEVQCALTGNLATPDLGACVCNYGYEGGYTVPCRCEAPKFERYVNSVQQRVCLDVGECAYDYDCAQGDTCVIPAGEFIGQCQ